jgi:hypothetical protein
MRLKYGSSARIVLLDGTSLVGTVKFSWRWRTVKLVEVTTHIPGGDVTVDGHLLIPARSILFVQVGA